MDMEELRKKLDSCVTSGIGIMISWSDAKDILQLKTENERLRGEKPIPSAWWKDCPGMAQRTMERIIAENKRVQKQICIGANALSVAEETIANLGTATKENEKIKAHSEWLALEFGKVLQERCDLRLEIYSLKRKAKNGKAKNKQDE